MSSFDAFDDNEAAGRASARGLWNDGNLLHYNSLLPSQRLDAFSSFAPATADAGDDDDEYGVETVELGAENEMFSPSPAGFGYVSDSGLVFPSASSPFSMPISDEDGYVEVGDGGGPILPPLDEMGKDEGFVLREWRRQNAVLLVDKENKEKELRNQIIAEAEVYKRAFFEKRKVHCETHKKQNREREKLFIVNQENFHVNAEQQYWEAISELIPREIASIEKKKGKKDQDKKPSVVIIQGPKLGKPTDLSRMRQILLKLKHSPPQHMNPPPPTETSEGGTTCMNAAAKQATPTSSKETPLAPSEQA